MTKVFCDRCGMEIPKKDGLDVYAWITHRCYYGSLRMVSSNNEPKIQEDNKYICPECEESYIHWFMNPAPKGGEVG